MKIPMTTPNHLGSPYLWDFSGVKLDMFALRDVPQPTMYLQTEEQEDEETETDQ